MGYTKRLTTATARKIKNTCVQEKSNEEIFEESYNAFIDKLKENEPETVEEKLEEKVEEVEEEKPKKSSKKEKVVDETIVQEATTEE